MLHLNELSIKQEHRLYFWSVDF